MEDDCEFVASEHDHLVNAITKLDKTQHITKPTRNEPTNVNSEFNLVKNYNKIQLNDVVKVLEDTAKNVKIGKKFRNIQKLSSVLPKPLEKPQAERVKRATGYEQTKIKIGRWDPVVARNRTVDHMAFPLKPRFTKTEWSKEYLSKFVLKSPLEKELEEIDPPNKIEEDEDEDQKYPMSYEEMLERRKNMAKMRAQQSYNAAKAKRQSKIKSKKYHRILKKEKLKQQLKEFEELQIKNPEEALKKLEELEKARALERHTLRHKNTGKWAKSKLVRAKYDKEVRQQLAEQLSVSRGLTHKTQNQESSDDEEANDDNIQDVTLAHDPMNPWMLKRSDKSNVDTDFDFGYKKYINDKMYKRQEERDYDSDGEAVINENEEPNVLKSLKESVQKLIGKSSENVADDAENEVKLQEKPQVIKKTKTGRKNLNAVTATTAWVVESVNTSNIKESSTTTEDLQIAFKTFESKMQNKVKEKINNLKDEIKNLNKQEIKKKSTKKNNKRKSDNIEYLKLNTKKKAIIDESLYETATRKLPESDETILKPKLLNVPKEIETKQNNMDIDPTRFIEVKPKYLNTALPSSVNDCDDLDDEQTVPGVDIGEVFEDDDVVASFRQEKQDEKNKDNLDNIELTLPGWGSWGGRGIKAPKHTKKRRNRFITKHAIKSDRRDENKGDIIINEYKDPKLTTHRVSEIPFPFSSVKDYEASIRAPVGNTFIPEQAHRKLIKPSVITKAGTIIEPMDEEELLVPRNQTFDNKILKMMAKK